MRRVGVDSEGYTYYVGRDDADRICLLVYGAAEIWGSSCGEPGLFVIELGDVAAWLSTPGFDGQPATENIDDIVFIARD